MVVLSSIIRCYYVLLPLYIKTIVLSVGQVVENFLHRAFPVIDVEPDYQSIHGMWDLFCNNASTIATMLGGVNHRHISIVIQDTLYMTISPTPYDAPVDPGVTATVSLQ